MAWRKSSRSLCRTGDATSWRCWPPVTLRIRADAAGTVNVGATITDRGFPSAMTTVLATLLSGTAKIQSGQVLFLTRG